MYCRSCQNQPLVPILALGKMPLANRLLNNYQLHEAEPKYDLELMLCQTCSLVQLQEIVAPEQLFTEYLYFSSISETMSASSEQLVSKILPTLSTEARVIEIASNDGYLLQHYIKHKIAALGIEPAKNIAKLANEKGIPTRNLFFNSDTARELLKDNWSADVIHANNVLAHVPDINDFVKGIATVLKDEGVAILEVPYLIELVDKCQFDTIYHEHVYYFSLTSLASLFSRHNLTIVNVEQLSIHGGSLRLYVKHSKGTHQEGATVKQMLQREQLLGIKTKNFFTHFSIRIQKIKHDLHNLLGKFRAEKKKVVAYGASAKGSTLLNYFGLDKAVLDFVVDRSPAKQNLFTPGAHLPIYPPDALLEQKVDYALLLSWNFMEEILQQQAAFTQAGGRFIIPIPEVKIIA